MGKEKRISAMLFSLRGAGGEATAAGDKNAEEPQSSRGITEETRRADPGAGAGEEAQKSGKRDARGPEDCEDAGAEGPGWS